jgi:hypothetical protein
MIMLLYEKFYYFVISLFCENFHFVCFTKEKDAKHLRNGHLFSCFAVL